MAKEMLKGLLRCRAKDLAALLALVVPPTVSSHVIADLVSKLRLRRQLDSQLPHHEVVIGPSFPVAASLVVWMVLFDRHRISKGQVLVDIAAPCTRKDLSLWPQDIHHSFVDDVHAKCQGLVEDEHDIALNPLGSRLKSGNNGLGSRGRKGFVALISILKDELEDFVRADEAIGSSEEWEGFEAVDPPEPYGHVEELSEGHPDHVSSDHIQELLLPASDVEFLPELSLPGLPDT